MATTSSLPIRNHRKGLERVMLGKTRRTLLTSYNWHKKRGKWVHPCRDDSLSNKELRALTPAQLNYKLMNGSWSKLPVWLS